MRVDWTAVGVVAAIVFGISGLVFQAAVFTRRARLSRRLQVALDLRSRLPANSPLAPTLDVVITAVSGRLLDIERRWVRRGVQRVATAATSAGSTGQAKAAPVEASQPQAAPDLPSAVQAAPEPRAAPDVETASASPAQAELRASTPRAFLGRIGYVVLEGLRYVALFLIMATFIGIIVIGVYWFTGHRM